VVEIRFPEFALDRGPGYWLRPRNVIASRYDLTRADNSNTWRYTFGPADPPDRSVPFSRLLGPEHSTEKGFRFVIIADTGEGDRSQYGLLPLLNYLKPQFMILVGDLANPAGRIDKSNNRNKDDYLAGFFEPYRNFGIPLWAVPGNHEYYGRGQGREFHESFCTDKYASRWSEYGLRLVKQPGTYWELKEKDSPLVVIGLDTGKKGNLDGSKGLFGKKPADDVQYRWLEERLTLTDRENKPLPEKEKRGVAVLFHIPGLVNGKKDKKKISVLYRILAAHPCVKFAISGHIHNFQEYQTGTVSSFLEWEFGCPTGGLRQRYVVNGGGGSALHSTDFKPGSYGASRLFPDADQWKEYLKAGGSVLQRTGLTRNLFGKVVLMMARAYKGDGDLTRFLSFILVDVLPQGADPPCRVRPVWMEELQKLYPPGAVGEVNVIDKNPILYQPEVDRCLKDDI
jgi:hypothetical protein